MTLHRQQPQGVIALSPTGQLGTAATGQILDGNPVLRRVGSAARPGSHRVGLAPLGVM
jgi:hypothetical protein